MRGRWFWLFLLCVGPAHAGDGDLDWRTVETPHFLVHYPVGLEAVAFRAARMSEEAHRVLVPIMDHTPDRRTHVLLSDFGDFANGSATALPYPRITLLAAPPALDGNLNDYDDWLRLLVFHEYVHILQLDNVSGLPAFLNQFLGKTMAPNQNLPSFQLEGEAVWAESLTSGRGRIRSAVFRGTLRAQALAGRLPTIDALIHAPLHFPGANVWYMHGGHFFDWLTRTRGIDVPAAAHDATSDQLVPFALNRAHAAATGQTLTALHRAWVADLTAKSRVEEAEVEALGRTPITAITTNGQRHESPRFMPDGALLAIHSAPQEVYGIYRHDADGQRLFADVEGTGRFDLCPDGRTLVYEIAQTHRGVYTHYDLFVLDVQTGARRRLTRGARARAPACAPDGRWVAATQIRQGRVRLVQVSLADGALRVLHDPGDLNQMGTPVVAPDGLSVVAARISQRYGRDLVRVDVASGLLTALTRDDALELHPQFTRDGRWLLYASDRDGIFDIFAREWGTGQVRRLTRVVNGALDPAVSPDGTRLVFRHLTAGGADLAETPFRPEAAAIDSVVAAPEVTRADTDGAPLPNRAYAATETLWPVAWSPSFSFSNATDAASQLGVELEAGDAAGQHFVLANVTTAPDVDALTASLSYSLLRFKPSIGISASHNTQSQQGGALHGSVPVDWRERVSSIGTSVGLPLARAGRGASATMRYSYTWFRPAENPDPLHDPFDRAPTQPEAREQGSLSASLRFGDTKSTPFAISTEQGRGLGLTMRVRHPHLGGELETAELFLDYTEYVDLWWRHVLAVRLVGAYGRGVADQRVFYALGAPVERNVFLDALDEVFLGSTFLRGYPAGTERGDRYLLATAEYRLPIVDVFAGPSTVPTFFRRLKLALFTDWGQADTVPLDPSPSAFRRSVGAELLSEATVGWRLNMTVRLGYAVGIDDDGEDQMYFFLGQWF